MAITKKINNGITSGFSTGFNANGSWQAVTIPTGQDCHFLRINCRPDDTIIYTHNDNQIEFHFTFNSDGTYFDWCTGIVIGITKDSGETVCYVRATSGYKFVVTGLK